MTKYHVIPCRSSINKQNTAAFFGKHDPYIRAPRAKAAEIWEEKYYKNDLWKRPEK